MAEIRKKEAYTSLFIKFNDNLTSWVHTAKVYTILHVGLQDGSIINEVAAELTERQKLLYFYQKRPDEIDHRILIVLILNSRSKAL